MWVRIRRERRVERIEGHESPDIAKCRLYCDITHDEPPLPNAGRKHPESLEEASSTVLAICVRRTGKIGPVALELIDPVPPSTAAVSRPG
jgi:hypothetical protein